MYRSINSMYQTDAMEVMIYFTNINTAADVQTISAALNTLAGIQRWTVDVDDRDKVLRIEAAADLSQQIEKTLTHMGYICQRMPV